MKTGFADITCCSSSFKNNTVYDVPIYSNFFYERQIYWTLPHFLCTRIDLFAIFVCSCYRLWATIRLLHHFGFVMWVNSRLYCMHFSCHWRKIRNVSCRLTQISKRQHDPWVKLKCMYYAGTFSIMTQFNLDHRFLHCIIVLLVTVD